MSERNHTYDDVLATVRERFEVAVEDAILRVEDAGGRFLSFTAIRETMAGSIKATVEELPDVAILSVVATRPHLLHFEPKLTGQLPTPRQSLDHAVKMAAYKELDGTMMAKLGEGQDLDTLPEAAAAALKALDGIKSLGVRIPDETDTRRILTSGDWEDDMVYGIGMPLAEFLEARGHAGVGNDLKAAIEAREAVMSSQAGPAPR